MKRTAPGGIGAAGLPRESLGAVDGRCDRSCREPSSITIARRSPRWLSSARDDVPAPNRAHDAPLRFLGKWSASHRSVSLRIHHSRPGPVVTRSDPPDGHLCRLGRHRPRPTRVAYRRQSGCLADRRDGAARRHEHSTSRSVRRYSERKAPGPLQSAHSRARVVAEEMPVQQRRQVSSTISEPARP